MTNILLYIAIFFNMMNQNANVEPTTVLHSSEIVEEGIKWYTWEEASELSKTAPKKIFVDLYTDWCGWCKKMDKETFVDPAVISYLNDNFYAVKFNAEQKGPVVHNNRTFEYVVSQGRGVHQLAYALLDGRLGYPAFVALDETFARIWISPGYKKPDQLIKELTFAKEEKYMEMSFNDFMVKAD